MLGVRRPTNFLFCLFVITTTVFWRCTALPPVVRIGQYICNRSTFTPPLLTLFTEITAGFLTGGLFDDVESKSIEGAFRFAIYRINNDDEILPHTRLAWDIQHLPAANSFVAAKQGTHTPQSQPYIFQLYREFLTHQPFIVAANAFLFPESVSLASVSPRVHLRR